MPGLYDPALEGLAAETKEPKPGMVVVTFGSAADEWCTLTRCPMGTATWFPDREAANAYCQTLPAAFEPHMLMVDIGQAPQIPDALEGMAAAEVTRVEAEPPPPGHTRFAIHIDVPDGCVDPGQPMPLTHLFANDLGSAIDAAGAEWPMVIYRVE